MQYDKLLTPEEVSKYLKVPMSTLRSWLNQKKIKGVKIASTWRIREKDLEEFIKDF